MYTSERTLFFLTLFLFTLCSSLDGQETFFDPRYPDKTIPLSGLLQQMPASVFDDTTILELRLQSDFTYLEAHKIEEEYQFGTLGVQYSDSLYMRCQVRIKTRGQSRKDYCAAPPFWINFKKSNLEVSELKHLSKVKIVNQCHPYPLYQNYLLREYLAYKVFEQLHPYSFKTRLAKITYVDTGNQGETWQQYAFLIEENDMLGERLALEEVNRPTDELARLDTTCITALSIAQFLLGNVDWHVQSGHNIKYYQPSPEEDEPVYLVGYDFDLSGFVNPAYGKPIDKLKMIDIRDRRFIGCPWSEATLQRCIQQVLDKQEAIEQTVLNFEYLSREDRRDMLRYLNIAFNQLANPKKVERALMRKCVEYDW